MNDRITIIGGVLTINGCRATKAEEDHIDAMVKIRALVEMNYGGVTWFEKARVASEVKPKPPKDLNRVETRGRPRGKAYAKRNIPVGIVVAMKERGLSGSEVARELFDLGYGEVSRDYANRVTRGIVKTGNLGGRPRKGE